MKSIVQREARLVLTAILFFTRLPLAGLTKYTGTPGKDDLTRCLRYFPLVGLAIGALAGAVFQLAGLILEAPIALLLALGTAVWITGGLHEDGFADVCDGFGGGLKKAKILAIMKDPTLGAFGVMGLFFLLALKFFALLTLAPTLVLPVLVAAHGISRLAALGLVMAMPYVRTRASKVGDVTQRISAGELAAAASLGAMGLVPLGLHDPMAILATLLPLMIIPLAMGTYFKRRIHGYTGDCLGAVQQVSEVCIYLIIGAI